MANKIFIEAFVIELQDKYRASKRCLERYRSICLNISRILNQ